MSAKKSRFGVNAALSDGAVPAQHRDWVLEASQHIDQAARLLGQTRHSYAAQDPAVSDLLEALIRLDVGLAILDGWLARHPARS